MSDDPSVGPGRYRATTPIPIAAGARFRGYYTGRSKLSLLAPDSAAAKQTANRSPQTIIFPAGSLVTRVTSFNPRTGTSKLTHMVGTVYRVGERLAVRGLYSLEPWGGDSGNTVEEPIVSPPGAESLPAPDFLKGVIWPPGSAIGLESEWNAIAVLPDGRILGLEVLTRDYNAGGGIFDGSALFGSADDAATDLVYEDPDLATNGEPQPDTTVLRDLGEIGKAFVALKQAQSAASSSGAVSSSRAVSSCRAVPREAWPVLGMLHDNGEPVIILGSKAISQTTEHVNSAGQTTVNRLDTLHFPNRTLAQDFEFRRGPAKLFITPFEQVIVIWEQSAPSGPNHRTKGGHPGASTGALPPALAIMDATPCIIGYLAITQHLQNQDPQGS